MVPPIPESEVGVTIHIADPWVHDYVSEKDYAYCVRTGWWGSGDKANRVGSLGEHGVSVY